MLISFLPNGQISTLNEEKNFNFIKKLGIISFSGDSKIILIENKNPTFIYKIWDSEGHFCKGCEKISHIFYQMINEIEFSEEIICKKCYE